MKSNYNTGTKMKRAGQGMTSSRVMTGNHMTHTAFFVFCFSKRQRTIKGSVFSRQFAIFFNISTIC